MGSAISLRQGFDSVTLRRFAKATKDAAQSRRLLALAEIYDGGRRSDAARIGGVGLQVIRGWVLRFNADGPPGLLDRKAPASSPKLNEAQRRALSAIVEDGPIPAIHGVVRWRLKDLVQWLFEEFSVSLDESTVSRELKALGFRKVSARPRPHAQNELAIEDYNKNFPAELAEIRAGLPTSIQIELWSQDEARVGQKNKITWRWAKRGTRPWVTLNITLLPLPTRSPELNPVENIWQFMSGSWLSNRVTNPTTKSSPFAARLGTSSSSSPGRLCPSDSENGRMGLDQCKFVLAPN